MNSPAWLDRPVTAQRLRLPSGSLYRPVLIDTRSGSAINHDQP
ncbi:MAG: hypothetical protein ACAF42_04105 [Limnothrix sp. BL-A-16]